MIVYVVLNIEDALRKRATYAIETVLEAIGVGYQFRDALVGDEEMVLCYGGSAFPPVSGHTIWIQCPCCPWLLHPEWDMKRFGHIDQSMRHLSYAGGSIPFWGDVTGGRGDRWAVTAPRGKKGGCRLRADLFGNVFFHLSRLEEWYTKERDTRDRFECNRSLLAKAGLLSWPVVDEYIKALGELLEGYCRRTEVPLIRKALWPDGKPFAVCLTHDVDRIKKWTWKRIVYEMLRTLSQLPDDPDATAKCLVAVMKSVARGENPYWNFETLLEDEDGFGAVSSFYFSTERKVKYDPSYTITDDRIQRLIRKLQASDREVGLHASYNAYNAYEDLKAERRDFIRLTGIVPRGLRVHYLRFDEGSTLPNANRLGFGYDTTLGYAEGEGFRAGTSLPFHPFDLSCDEPLGLLEIPFCIMDKTLTDYQNYDAETAEKSARSMWDAIRRFDGLFTILLHQASYDVAEYPYMRAWYRTVLKWMRQEAPFCATAERIADWWIGRIALRLVEARRDDSGAIWHFVSSQRLERMKLSIIVQALIDKLSIEVQGCPYRIEREEECIGLIVGPIEKGREIWISVQC